MQTTMGVQQSVASRLAAKFRSTVTWKDSDWQNPQDALTRELNLAAFTHGNGLGEPVEFTVDQWAILHSGFEALTLAREANDMPKFLRIIQQVRERALEFIKRNIAGNQTTSTANNSTTSTPSTPNTGA